MKWCVLLSVGHCGVVRLQITCWTREVIAGGRHEPTVPQIILIYPSSRTNRYIPGLRGSLTGGGSCGGYQSD